MQTSTWWLGWLGDVTQHYGRQNPLGSDCWSSKKSLRISRASRNASRLIIVARGINNQPAWRTRWETSACATLAVRAYKTPRPRCLLNYRHRTAFRRLKSTDSYIASKPQLARTESQQSEAASDDYYSFSDRAASSLESLATIMRFRTPDSHVPSPAMSQINLAQEDRETQRPPTSSTVRFVEDRPGHISPMSDGSRSNEASHRSPSDYPGPAPTPGLDDSPYVRFAIDQLTQDRSRGVQRTDSISTTTTSDYPTDRLVWDELN